MGCEVWDWVVKGWGGGRCKSPGKGLWVGHPLALRKKAIWDVIISDNLSKPGWGLLEGLSYPTEDLGPCLYTDSCFLWSSASQGMYSLAPLARGLCRPEKVPRQRRVSWAPEALQAAGGMVRAQMWTGQNSICYNNL